MRQEQAEQTKESILQVALRLFSERGFSATSTKRIATEAGVSEGLIFHHFGTKRGLLDAIAHSQHSLAGRFRHLLEEADGVSARRCLDSLGRAFLEFISSDAGVFSMLITESQTDPDLRHAVHAVLGETRRGLQGFFAARQESGELAGDFDVAARADLFVTSLVGLVMTQERPGAHRSGGADKPDGAPAGVSPAFGLSGVLPSERAERYVTALVDAVAGGY